MTATTLFVVPRSMPIIFAMVLLLLERSWTQLPRPQPDVLGSSIAKNVPSAAHAQAVRAPRVTAEALRGAQNNECHSDSRYPKACQSWQISRSAAARRGGIRGGVRLISLATRLEYFRETFLDFVHSLL